MPDINDLNNELDTVVDDTVSGVDPAPKNGKKIAIGVTAGVVALAAGGGVAYAASDYVKNQVNLVIKSPQSYYAWVNENNAEDIAKQTADIYRKVIEKNEKGQASDLTVKYELSDEAKDYVLSELFELDGGSDEEKELSDVINNLDSMELGFGLATKQGKTSGSIYGNVNGDRLATLDIAASEGAEEYFMRVPELTEQWLGVSISDIVSEIPSSEDQQQLLEAYKEILKDPASFLSPEELEAEITRYTGVWNASIDEVTLEKKQSVDISDITVEYTVASIELTDEKAAEIARNFIKEAKNDSVIKSIVVDKLGVLTAEEYDKELADALDELDDDDLSGEDKWTIDTYIDAKGTIRGFGFSDGEDISARFVIGCDGDQVRGEGSYSDGEQDKVIIELSAQADGKKYSGSLDLSYTTADYDWEAEDIVDKEQTASVEFTDYEVVDEEYGTFNADLTFIIPDVSPFSVKCSGGSASQEISFDLDIDGTNYGKIVFKSTVKDGAEPEVPDKGAAFMVGLDNDIEFADYVPQDKFESFISDVLKKLGLSDEINDALTSELSDNVYNLSSYGDDDWDWDDDDWDYDDYDWDDDQDYDDDDLDLDWDDSDWLNEYYPNGVAAKDGQAYISIIDNSYIAYYSGEQSDSLAEGAKLADISKNGTYTLSITADSDQYKEFSDGDDPDGIYLLAVSAEGVKDPDKISINVKSLKIDGKEYAITGSSKVSDYGDGSIDVILYFDGWEDETIVDLSSVTSWKNIEITIEVAGL